MKFTIKSQIAPVVEIDTAVSAAYVRFSDGKVARTLSPECDDVIVTLDLDKEDRVLGVEILGVREFNLDVLLKKIPFLRAEVPIELAKYVSSESRSLETEPA